MVLVIVALYFQHHICCFLHLCSYSCLNASELVKVITFIIIIIIIIIIITTVIVIVIIALGCYLHGPTCDSMSWHLDLQTV